MITMITYKLNFEFNITGDVNFRVIQASFVRLIGLNLKLSLSNLENRKILVTNTQIVP